MFTTINFTKMKKFFKLVFNLIDKIYVAMLIVFGFLMTCCVLFKPFNEINWYEYAGAISLGFVIFGWVTESLIKLRAKNKSTVKQAKF